MVQHKNYTQKNNNNNNNCPNKSKFHKCIIIPTYALSFQQWQDKKKKIVFFNYDVMMMSSSSPWVEQPWFWLYKSREGKKNSAKKLSNFQHKQPVFHHQTLIHQSWLKICTKTHKRRAIRNPSFRNPINKFQKTKKKLWVFLQKVFSTSLQHQLCFKMEN